MKCFLTAFQFQVAPLHRGSGAARHRRRLDPALVRQRPLRGGRRCVELPDRRVCPTERGPRQGRGRRVGRCVGLSVVDRPVRPDAIRPGAGRVQGVVGGRLAGESSGHQPAA
jgi:hypothetical protein